MLVACANCPLRELSCFRPLPAQVTEVIRINQRALGPRAELAYPEDGTTRVFTLFSGWAVRYHALNDGRRQIIDFVLPGDLVVSRATSQGPVNQGVSAVTEVVVCALDADTLRRSLARRSRHATEFFRTLMLEAARFERRLLLVGQQRPTERLAYLLLELRDRINERHSNKLAQTVQAPLSYQHMSESIGVSRAQLARSLTELEQRGWLRRDKGEFELPQIAQLALFCSYDLYDMLKPRTLI